MPAILGTLSHAQVRASIMLALSSDGFLLRFAGRHPLAHLSTCALN